MKNIFKTVLGLAVAMMAFSGCSDDDETYSDITVYPVFTLADGDFAISKTGQELKHPELKVTLSGEEVEYKTEDVNSFDKEKEGVYRFDHSYTNKDGFTRGQSTFTVNRKGEFTVADIEGKYTFEGGEVTISKLGEGVIAIPDAWPTGTTIKCRVAEVSEGKIVVFPENSSFGPISGSGEITATGFTLDFTLVYNGSALVRNNTYTKVK
ncbi:hypothetical protein FUAX_27800 [Fulvitalea axinellae]|uniref:Uncharacterized protein n=1 Tax=Fulvitalea axinellae TaxID=1182444 RepID=A0AAU9CJN1_9BACT|nr:hypothetical protein FUAX_27800 [Fulvitalea axinellae]